jgi:hypothetical protein
MKNIIIKSVSVRGVEVKVEAVGIHIYRILVNNKYASEVIQYKDLDEKFQSAVDALLKEY